MTQEDKEAIIGVYESHLEAIEALKILQAAHFNMKHVAFLGKGEAIQDVSAVHTWEESTTKGIEVGAILGGTLGVVAGLGLLPVVGFGVILYAGTAIGATLLGVEGAAAGAVTGGILGTIFGGKYGTEGKVSGKQDKEDYEKYHEEIDNGKFLIVVHGSADEVKKGHDTLIEHANHEHISSSITGL